MFVNKKEIEKKNLFLLDSVIDVLNEHNLNWFAGYGTLLGAIRKGGFIPWDDDCDLLMLREDYNKLLKFGRDWFKEPLFFQTVDTDEYFRMFIRIRLDGTTYLCKWDDVKRGHHGMVLDIFPLDHVSDDLQKRKELLDIRNMFCTSLRMKMKSPGNELSKEAFKFYNDFMTKINEENKYSKYLIDSGDSTVLKIECTFPRDSFTSYREVKFHGINNMLRIPEMAENILSISYGEDWKSPKNYMRNRNILIDPSRDYLIYRQMAREEINKLFEK